MDWDELVQAATQARLAAYAPYSLFKVGAAVRTDDGSVHTGCNVENRSFGLTICAERVAMGSAIAAGHRKPIAVAVVTDVKPDPDLPILLSNPDGERCEYRLQELLPHPFVFPDL
jgi:cytidine deaminase